MGRASILYRPLRLPRFSLRGLLLFFPLVALLIGGAANELAEYRREQAAWLELEQLGGQRSGFDDARRSWGARMLGPLLPEMDRITGMRLGSYTPRNLPAAELDRAMELLTRLPRLRDLSLDGLNVTDKHLAPLTRLPDLIHLDLQSTRITDRGLAILDQMPALLYASLGGTEISDAAIERLPNQAKARYWLELKVSTEGGQLMGISPSPELPEQLSAGRHQVFPAPTPAAALHIYAPLPPAAYDRLRRWRQIDQATQLTLGGDPNLRDELLRVAAWPQVESFELAEWYQPGPAQIDLAFAHNWTKLQRLVLPPSQVGAEELNVLARCRELSSLHCPSARFDDEAAKVIVRNHPRLQILYLGECRLTDRGLAIIASLPDLRILEFKSALVSDEGLEVLRAHAALEQLELDWDRYPPQTRIDFGEMATTPP
ncbi:MAG: hypothetical protein U0836_15480 [Pirellulales bacterium]